MQRNLTLHSSECLYVLLYVLSRQLSYYVWYYLISIFEAAKLFLGLRDVQVLRQIAQVIRDLFQLLDCYVPVIGVWQDLAHIKQAHSQAASIAIDWQKLLLLEATGSSRIRTTYSFGGARGLSTLLRTVITSICGLDFLFH